MPRQTPDLIALILAIVVAAVVLMTTVTLLWIRITDPSQDTTRAAMTIAGLVNVLTGVLVGYIAGKASNK